MCKYQRGKVKMWSWQEGRQDGGGYFVFHIWRWMFDVILIKFPEGSEIKEHIDPVDKGRHYRATIILKHACKGGKFVVHYSHVDGFASRPMIDLPRFKLFRPDIQVHSVTKVEKGTRWTLSIGWIK